MKDIPKYVVVIPQADGSLYPLKFHSDYDEAVETANNHDKHSEKKSQIRSDGPEVWKAFEERERQEKNSVLDDIAGVGAVDEIMDVSKSKKELVKRLASSEDIIKLVEFAEKLEPSVMYVDTDDVKTYTYEFIPNQSVRPYGLLFWGPPETLLHSIKIVDENQLAVTDAISIRFFLNPYISIEAVQYWVEKRAKLQYTNILFPAMKPGDKMQVIVDKPCTICVCGMKQG